MAIELTDDGTLDTVLRCSECGEEFRYNFDEHGEDCTVEDGSCDCYDAFVEWAIEDAESEHDCAPADEPTEDDLTTTDHETFYQYGTKVLELGARDEWWFDKQTGGIRCNSLLGTFPDYRAAIRAYMDRVRFWPNAWFISDHGNAHRIDLTKGK